MHPETRLVSRRASLGALVVGLALVATPIVAAEPCFDLGVFAGRGVGDGGAATDAVLGAPREVTSDASGNLFIADTDNARIRRVDAASGIITTVAGAGAPGAGRDGEQALFARLDNPSGIAVDAAGTLYVADTENHTVWRVTRAGGVLERFIGSGVATGSKDGDHPGASGNDPSDDLNDGQAAVFATLRQPVRIALDSAGHAFVSDLGNNRVRRVDAVTGRIETVASAANGIAEPIGLAFGPDGALFVANRGSSQILRIASGTVSVVAGSGTAGPPVNDIPATTASLNRPGSVAVDDNGVVYIGDTDNHVIRKVGSDGMIRAVAGSGLVGDLDGPGFLSRFNHPGVALAPDGTLLIADVDNNRVRRYDAAADRTTTIAGGPNLPGDGGPATAAILSRPTGLAVADDGAVYVTEHDSHRVRRIDGSGTISTVVNQRGLNGSPREGFPAINEPLRQPTGVTVNAGGLLVTDARDHRVFIVGADGLIRTFAGNGVAGFSGDGGPANTAQLDTPLRLALGADGSVYLADFNNHRIRRIDGSGTITTVAGTGVPGNAGDGGQATAAQLFQPAGLAFDGAGNLYVADFGNHRVRRIDTAGTITTVAGSGTPGTLGDGGAAGSAQLNGPTDVLVLAEGALVIIDQLNNTVRHVAPGTNGAITSGSTITTILGDGRPAFADGPGLAASLLIPTDVAVDATGRLLVADRGNQRVRVATPATDCTPAAPACGGPADCDDADPCTVDTCAAGACRFDRVGEGDCRPRCAAEPDGCIPGGGPTRFDCLVETLVKAPLTIRRGFPAPTVRCLDNDPACDYEPAAGQCTFRMAWCLNQTDDRIACGAAAIGRVVVRGPAAGSVLDAVAKLAPQAASRSGAALVFANPFTTPEACTDLMGISVALRKNGRRPGKLVLKATAVGVGRPRAKDADRVRLVCLP